MMNLLRRALLCLTLAAAFAVPANSQNLDIVSVGAVSAASDAAFMIADRKGFFRDEGINVKFITFNSANDMIAPLGTGQLDAGGGGVSAGLYNAFGRGVQIKIVADRSTDTPGYGYNVFVVRKDLVTSGRYKTIADLRGLKFAEPSKGNPSLPLIERILAKGGLKYDDVDHVYLSYPDQLIALQNGGIDATCLLEPWATQAVKLGVATRIAGDDAFYPNQQIAVLLYGDSFIQKRPDVAKRFMVAYLRAVRYYAGALKDGHISGRNSAEVIGFLSDTLKVKDASIFRDMTASGINPTGRVNLKSLENDYGIFKQHGLLTSDVSVAKAVDTTFIDYANSVLGPYKPGAR
jgi:NitT/TauT family transport system substrate-binding protein